MSSGENAGAFAACFGLHRLETHRSADTSGVVALEVTDRGGKKGFIPYTDRPLSWHTDGYYNKPKERIRSMYLHCRRPATAGGENALLDPEIAYLRLRDENPAFVEALMHPEAMSIPENTEPDDTVRPLSVGPVFYPDPATGRLQMRYTARTRSIAWRDDSATRDARDFLQSLLEAEEPLALALRLGVGGWLPFGRWLLLGGIRFRGRGFAGRL